jgi:hypothetical protein
MFNKLNNIFSTLSIVSLNIYTIIEAIKKTFPIFLAIASLILTVTMIIVQLKKNKLVAKEYEQQKLECEKTQLEIDDLKRRAEHGLSNG